MTVTESPYRVTAEVISSTRGQNISAGGVWNVMQRLGERISEEEEHAVKQMNAAQAEGTKEIPAAREGIIYKGMGVQESQNCTVITLRMKNRRMRWSVNEANNLAKALYHKGNKELIETIDRYTHGLVIRMQMQEIIETLSAAMAPKRVGKGNPYVEVVNAHILMKSPFIRAMVVALNLLIFQNCSLDTSEKKSNQLS